MILTGPGIRSALRTGAVRYDAHDGPFRAESWVGPNSLDLHLGPRLAVYRRSWLDWLLGRPLDSRDPPELVWVRGAGARQDPGFRSVAWTLRPGRVYLGSTWESVGTAPDSGLVPMLDGRSSLARLGVSAHLAAGRGDVGFYGRWTVELTVAQPIVLYAGDRLFQVSFWTTLGPPDPYVGRYAEQNGPRASKGF
jgi:dCTP deaminase